MRQWEVIGITDVDRWWSPPSSSQESLDDTRWTFFWSTDAALRFRTVSDAAAEALGFEVILCEGEDLLSVVGMEGESLAIIEAHAEALSGREASFTLRGEDGPVRCRVSPMHAGDGRVIGTFCLAGEDDPEPVARPLLVTAA